jgi:hypothetical protein
MAGFLFQEKRMSFNFTKLSALIWKNDAGGTPYKPVKSEIRTWGKEVEDGLNLLANQSVSVLSFGAMGDGIADDTLAIQATLDFARDHGGKEVFLPAGIYKITAGLLLHSYVSMRGEGTGVWSPTLTNVTKTTKGTEIRATGAAVKNVSFDFITDNRTAGGKVINPHTTSANDTHYALTSYLDETGLPFNLAAAIRTERGGKRCRVSDLRILLNKTGIDGYNDLASTTLADDWDIGLLNNNCAEFEAHNVQVVGYWRKNGLLQLSTIDNDATNSNGKASAEYSRYSGCLFTGKVGVGIRASDLYRVVNKGTDWVEIENAVNLPFHQHPTGSLHIGVNEYSYGNYTYSAAVVTGANLRFTIVEAITAVVIGNALLAAVYSLGVSNTVFRECQISSLDHSSKKRAQEVGFTSPGCALEISGRNLRGISFPDTKIITWDDVLLHIHNAFDLWFTGQFMLESKADATTNVKGGRVITSPTPANNTRVTNPMGGSYNIVFDFVVLQTNNTIDMRPKRMLTPPRFPALTGFFECDSFVWNQYMLNREDGGAFLRPMDGKAAGFMKHDGVKKVYYDGATGDFTVDIDTGDKMQVLINGVESGLVNNLGVAHSSTDKIPHTFQFTNMPNGSFQTIDFGRLIFAATVTVSAPGHIGIFQSRAATSPTNVRLYDTTIAGITNIDALTGVVTGSTGAAGKISLATETPGKFHIENRSGATKTVIVTIATGN